MIMTYREITEMITDTILSERYRVWNTWAENWLLEIDRTEESATAAADYIWANSNHNLDGYSHTYGNDDRYLPDAYSAARAAAEYAASCAAANVNWQTEGF